LKVTIKGKEDDNKQLSGEIQKMQREVNITNKEMELTEIRTAEYVRTAESADVVSMTTQTDKANSEPE